MERSCGPMDKNRMKGAVDQGERTRTAKLSWPGGSGVDLAVVQRGGQRVPAQVPGLVLLGGSGVKTKRRVSDKPIATFEQGVRRLTSRAGGRSPGEVVIKLRIYVLGWKAYFRLAQTPRVWQDWTSGCGIGCGLFNLRT